MDYKLFNTKDGQHHVQYNALVEALIQCAEKEWYEKDNNVRVEDEDAIMVEVETKVTHYFESSPTPILVIELIDKLNDLGFEIVKKNPIGSMELKGIIINPI